MRVHARFAILAATLLVSCQHSEEPAMPPAFDITHDVDDLMIHVIDPAAKAMWSHVGWLLSEEGVEAIEPESETEWRQAEYDAAILAEMGNLLLLPGRIRILRDDDDKPLESDNGDWTKYAVAMTTRAFEVKQATIARDTRAMFTSGAEVYKTCMVCHDKYIPKDDTKRLR